MYPVTTHSTTVATAWIHRHAEICVALLSSSSLQAKKEQQGMMHHASYGDTDEDIREE